jgi:hypothetical protein
MRAADIRVAAGDHSVRFYADDEDRCASVAGYLRSGLCQGETVIVAAAPATRAAVETGLDALGVPVDAAQERGRLMLLDTAVPARKAALLPDFESEIGTVIRRAVAAGRPVRAYGETAALLPREWNDGQVIELERLWNGLARQVPFALLCGYPWSLVVSRARPLGVHGVAGPPRPRDAARRGRRQPGAAPAAGRPLATAGRRP